jgi:hypothetical protein
VEKVAQKDNRTVGENSANLVTLLSFFSRLVCPPRVARLFVVQTYQNEKIFQRTTHYTKRP